MNTVIDFGDDITYNITVYSGTCIVEDFRAAPVDRSHVVGSAIKIHYPIFKGERDRWRTVHTYW